MIKPKRVKILKNNSNKEDFELIKKRI